jgi:hypothetical protein
LLESVHTGIGASRANNSYRCVGDFGQGLFQLGLHRTPLRLPLPAAKSTAVVFYA